MEVNIKAATDALEEIIARNKRSVEYKRKSAIIQRRMPTPPLAKIVACPASSDPKRPVQDANLKESKRSPSFQNTNFAVDLQQEREAEPKCVDEQLSGVVQNAADHTNRNLFTKRPSRRSATTRSPHLRTKEGSQAASCTSVFGDPSYIELLKSLESEKLVKFEVVQSTGTGVENVLLAQRSVRHNLLKGQVPSKCWVTNVGHSPYATAVFTCADSNELCRRKGCSSPRSSDSNHKTTDSSENVSLEQGLTALLVVDNSTRKPSPSKHRTDGTNRAQYSYKVTIETSCKKDREFLAVCTVPSIANNVARMEIPGNSLNVFLRLTVSPVECGNSIDYIRILAVCFFCSSNWSSETCLPASTDCEQEKGNMKRLPNKRFENNYQTPSSNAEALTGGDFRGHTEDGSNSFSIHCLTDQHHAKTRTSTSSNYGTNAGIAQFVKDTALKKMRKDDIAGEHLGVMENSVEYNWFTDALTRSSRDQETILGATGQPVKELQGVDEGLRIVPVAEYIQTLQAWNSVPSFSLEKALHYCMTKTTSFSICTVAAPEIFAESTFDHFTLPFKFQVCVVVNNTESIDQTAQGLPPCAALPPLHLLSAIACHARASDNVAELLFTCPCNSGFGCLFRSISDTPTQRDDRCKILFVVPSEVTNRRSDVAAQTTRTLLECALVVHGTATEKVCGISTFSTGCRCVSSPTTLPVKKPCGVLKLLLDDFSCMEMLTSVLAQWSKVSGSIRYYGSSTQKILQILFSPLGLLSNLSAAQSTDSSFQYKHAALWNHLYLRRLGSWKPESFRHDSEVQDVVAVELEYCPPEIYVWQSPRSSLRLVLTDTHFIENLTSIDGCVAPSSLTTLAESYFKESLEDNWCQLHLVSYSEAPWCELVKAAVTLSAGSETHICETENNISNFYALRRRVTVAFVFHILGSAFKRGWIRVSASVPFCGGEYQRLSVQLKEMRTMPLRHEKSVEEDNYDGITLFDQDAFMDTLAQWNYPFPRVVILHCSDILHADSLVRLQSPTSLPDFPVLTSQGVSTVFSRDALDCFSTVSSLGEALA